MDEKVVSQLMDSLGEAHGSSENRIYESFRNIGEPAVKPLLRELVQTYYLGNRPCKVSTALRNVGKPAMAPLTRLLESALDSHESFSDYLERELSFSQLEASRELSKLRCEGLLLHYVVETIGKIGEKEKDASAGPVLLRALDSDCKYIEKDTNKYSKEDKTHELREDVSKALSHLACQSAVPELISRLNTELPTKTEYSYILALGHLQDPRAIASLLPFLASKSEEIRKHAKTSLVNIGGDATAKACYDFLIRSSTDILSSPAYHNAFWILEEVGPISTPYLNKLLEKTDVAEPTKKRIKVAKERIKAVQDLRGNLHHYLLDHQGLQAEIRSSFDYRPYFVENTKYGLLIREEPEIKNGSTERLLIMKPGGLTDMNPHPGTVHAKITHLGVLGTSTRTFKKSRQYDAVLLQYYENYERTGESKSRLLYSGDTFQVVKGEWGYWHSLHYSSNRREGPAVLHLHKEMSLAAK